MGSLKIAQLHAHDLGIKKNFNYFGDASYPCFSEYPKYIAKSFKD